MRLMRAQAVEAAEGLAKVLNEHYAGAKGVQVQASRRKRARVEVFLSSPVGHDLMGHDLMSLRFHHNARPLTTIRLIDAVLNAL